MTNAVKLAEAAEETKDPPASNLTGNTEYSENHHLIEEEVISVALEDGPGQPPVVTSQATSSTNPEQEETKQVSSQK